MRDLKYRIISAFPGVGKTFSTNNSEFRLMDSDSSLFPREKGMFPGNYIQHIKSTCSLIQSNSSLTTTMGILVSTHQNVRASLVSEQMPFHLVYPIKELKGHFMDRYVKRGSPDTFLQMMDSSWDSLIDSCMNQVGCKHYLLSYPEENLSDILPQIV